MIYKSSIQLLLTFLMICKVQAQASKQFHVHGEIDKHYSGPVTLRYQIIQDSSVSYYATSTDGKFDMDIKLTESVPALLSISPPSTFEYCYLDTFNMIIRAHVDTVEKGSVQVPHLTILKIEGSRSQVTYQWLTKEWIAIETSDLSQEQQSNRLYKLLDSLVKIYPDQHFMSEALFFAEILTYQQATEIYRQLSPRQKSSSYKTGLTNLLERLKKIDRGTAVVFHDLFDESGNPVSLIEDNTRFVLLDFWASWCKPCREQNPEWKKVYDQYHSKGLRIIGVSLDDDKSKWVKAIQDDQLPWVNASDLKGWKGDIPVYYGLVYVPFNLLVDNKGIIIGKNITPKQVKNIMDRQR